MQMPGISMPALSLRKIRAQAVVLSPRPPIGSNGRTGLNPLLTSPYPVCAGRVAIPNTPGVGLQ
jgi:hypothetical protein